MRRVSVQSEVNPRQASEARIGQQPVARRRPTLARAALRTLLRYGGSALALALLFRFLPGWQVLRAMGKLPATLWIGVIAAYLVTHLLGVAKWRLMVNTAGAGLKPLQAARCYFAGLFGSLFLPSLIGGDLVRVTLAMRYGKTRAGVLLGSFVDRIVDFTALVILAVAGALLVPGALEPQSRRVFLWIGAAVGLGLAILAVLLTLIPFRRLSFRIRRRAVGLRRAGRSIAQQPGASIAALSISLAAQLSFITLSVVLAEACGLRLLYRAWLFAWPIAKLSAAIPVTQGGIGIREAALAGLLVPFGAPPTLTVAAGLAWEGVVIGGALVGGAFALCASRKA
jgi:glycosyltransferase 2 family protein